VLYCQGRRGDYDNPKTFKQSFFLILGVSLLKSGRVERSSYETERRRTPRHNSRIEAELVAGLSLLDAAADEDSSQTLLLMGVTLNVSDNGLAVALPSIRIDEGYFKQARPVSVALHLPNCPLQMKAELVHCVPLQSNDPNQGYLIGARITDQRETDSEWKQYVRSLES
jgi:hypothetical protein